MKLSRIQHLIFLSCLLLIGACANEKKQNDKPKIAYLDLLEDETLAQARQGFWDALAKNGYSEKDGSLEVIYKNANGDQMALVQACDYMVSQNVDIIATNPTLSTITAVKKSGNIPVCMMVSPRPDLAGLASKDGTWPSQLFGVYETLDYIDSSLALAMTLQPEIKKIGLIYNQSEPQSVDAFNEVKNYCAKRGIGLEALPVNASSETQQVTSVLLSKSIDAFFALPDNVIFASFETVKKLCDEKKIPIYTSEAGLVKRGAKASFGADFYQWGYQAGLQAADYLKDKSKLPAPQPVKNRIKTIGK
ncbi:MAG: ABC transporter substrate-binding protein [Bacteroidia bacterium]|nr:ABC transporter substrate-binding protein [Bacteroidia bacterium]